MPLRKHLLYVEVRSATPHNSPQPLLSSGFKIRESTLVKNLGNVEHIDMGHTGISHLGTNKKER